MGDQGEEKRWGAADVEHKTINISSDNGETSSCACSCTTVRPSTSLALSGAGSSDESGGDGGAGRSESADPPSSSSNGWLVPHNGTSGANPFGLSDYDVTRIKVYGTIAVGVVTLWSIYAGRRCLSRLWRWWQGQQQHPALPDPNPDPDPDPDPALDPEPQVEEPEDEDEDEAENEQLALPPGGGRGQLALPPIPMGGPFIPRGGARGGVRGRGRGRGRGHEVQQLMAGRGRGAPPVQGPGLQLGNGPWELAPDNRVRKG